MHPFLPPLLCAALSSLPLPACSTPDRIFSVASPLAPHSPSLFLPPSPSPHPPRSRSPPRPPAPPAPSPAGGGAELCHGYYDVMGHYDAAFNCSTEPFRFCCGSCQLRFCCGLRARRLEQRRCTNRRRPGWAATPPAGSSHAPPAPPPYGNHASPGGHASAAGPGSALGSAAAGGGGAAAYAVCGVVTLGVAVGLAARALLSRAGGAGRAAGGDGSRALVEILRQQAGGGQPQRRSSGVLPPPPPDSGAPRPPKSLYSADSGPPHSYLHLDLGTPEHRAATLDWRMPRAGPLSCSRSFHNLSHPPPPYESPPQPPGLGPPRCASLKRLADRELEELGGWGAPPWEPPRGTLPLPPLRGGPTRRVLSQELLLGGSGGGTMPRSRGGGPRERLPSPSPRYAPGLNHAVSQSSLGGGLGGGGGCPGTPLRPPQLSGAPPRRQAFGAHRQSIAELQLLPGPPPGHHLRTGSRTEVTV